MADRIERTVEIGAPVERVWRALTDHTEFGTWFKVRLDHPFALGQPSTGQMTYPGFEHFPWIARVTAMEPPRRFAFEWPHLVNAGDDPDTAPWTLVEFTLETAGGATRLTIVESGFERVPEDRRAEAMRMNEGGWTEQAQNVKAHAER